MFNTSKPEQKYRNLSDDIFNWIVSTKRTVLWLKFEFECLFKRANWQNVSIGLGYGFVQDLMLARLGQCCRKPPLVPSGHFI